MQTFLFYLSLQLFGFISVMLAAWLTIEYQFSLITLAPGFFLMLEADMALRRLLNLTNGDGKPPGARDGLPPLAEVPFL